MEAETHTSTWFPVSLESSGAEWEEQIKRDIYTNSACEIERRENHMEADGSRADEEGWDANEATGRALPLEGVAAAAARVWRRDRFDSARYRQL